MDMGEVHDQRTDLAGENARLREELAQCRALLSLAQIRTHFFCNTLNTIDYMISVDPEKARIAIYDLGGYMRSKMAALGGRDRIPLAEELDCIKYYLELQHQRYGDRLRVSYSLKATGFSLPAFSVQPLVENAVRHGLAPHMEKGGNLRISSGEEEGLYTIAVEDDGVGFDPHSPSVNGQGIGLQNIRTRILGIGELELHSRPGFGTRATLKFNKEKLEES